MAVSASVGTQTNLVLTLTNPDVVASAGDNFGGSMDMTATHILVGAPLEDSATDTSTGAAYLYNREGTLLRTFVNPDSAPAAGDFSFGRAVGLNSTKVFIARGGDFLTAGDVYVYSISTGTLLTTITVPENGFIDAIRADDTQVIIGSGTVEGAGGEVAAGQAWVYDAVAYTLTYTLVPQSQDGDGIDQARFGSSVDITATHIAVGAYGTNFFFSVGPGCAYIYSATTGALLQTIFDASANRSAGRGVSLNATQLAVGADTIGNAVYTISTGAFEYTIAEPATAPIAFESDFFNVHISSDLLFATASRVDSYYTEDADATGDVNDSGEVIVFRADTGFPLTRIRHPEPILSGQFGRTLAGAGNSIAVGAYDAAGEGVVYVYQF